MNPLSFSCLALCALLLVPACSSAPPPVAGPRVQERALRIGPPAVAGQDGPVGMTALDTPTPPWVGAPGLVRTTADIMAEAARRPRRALDLAAPRFEKVKPDRSGLPQNPAVLPDTVTPALDRRSGPLTAQTVTTPTVDVATVADTGSLPPDTQGDIGPTQYFAALNGRIRTLDKSTGLADGVLNADSDVFFSSVAASAGTSDPRVRYDRRTKRWFVIMINVALPNRYLAAVGDTFATNGTITGGTTWTFYQWTNTRTQGGVGGAAGCLGDYPTLGVDEDALYIGVNLFCGSGLSSLVFDSTSLYVLNKASLFGGTLSVAQFDGVLPSGTSSGIFTPQGVDNFDANTNAGYFIGVDNLSLGTLVLRRVSSPGAAPSLSADITVAVPATSVPLNVPQQGNAAVFDGLDDRLLQAVIRNGRLWTTHQIKVNAAGAAAGGDRNGVRWYELRSLDSTPALAQSGTVFDGAATSPLFYWMGAIMPNGQGHVALGMSRSGAAAFANAAVTGRLAGDPAGAMDPPGAFSNASSSYAIQGPGTQRWGDYSYTSVDPADDMTFWTLQEYVDAPNSYAVRLTRLLAPPPATIASVLPVTIATGQTGVLVTVTGAATGGRGFFDPGAAFARRLTASFGAGVTVTNAVVASPTSLTLTIDTAANAALGARTLTVTNPDGQTAALAAALTIGSGVNQAPVFGTVPASRTLFDAGSGATTGALAFQVGDPEGAPVTVTATSSNTAVIPAASIALGGTGIDRAIALTSVGAFGSSTITLTASDGALTATTSFVVTVALSTVPTAPQNLTATVIRNTLVFSWQAPMSAATEPVTGYRLEAGLAPGGLLGALALGNTLTYTLTAPSGVYYLRVRAQTLAGVSEASNEVRVAAGDAEPPLAPRALLATVQGTAVTLQWTENPLGPVIAGYQVQAGTAAGLTDIGAAPLAASARSLAVVAPPGTYFLRVVAVNAAGASVASNEATIAPRPGMCTIPATPSGFTASAQSRVLSVGWNPAASGAIPTAYQLQAGTVTGGTDIGVVNFAGATTAVAGAVPPGSYFLRVIAGNACGASSASTEVSVTVP